MEEIESIEIELELEEWGKLALLAHKHNITINEMIVKCLEAVIEQEQAKEENQ